MTQVLFCKYRPILLSQDKQVEIVPEHVKQLLLHGSHFEVVLLLIYVGVGQVDKHWVPNKKVPVTHDKQLEAVVWHVEQGETHLSHSWLREFAK